MGGCGDVSNLALGGLTSKNRKRAADRRSLLCFRSRKRIFGQETAESIEAVLEQLGRVQGPPGLKTALRELGIGPQWVLGAVKTLVEHPDLSAGRRADMLEIANWWAMLATGLYPDRSRVASKFIASKKRSRRPTLEGMQSLNPAKASEAKAIGPMVDMGEEKIENKGRTPGVSPFPGGVVPEGKDRREKRRDKYMGEKLGRGFLQQVANADNE